MNKVLLQLKKLNQFIYSFFNIGHRRSIQAKRNIVASFVIIGSNIFINLLLVRLILDYINPTQYGIWLTLSSVLVWFSLFDIGLGNGLRNKFAEALVKKENNLARIYLSTAYATLIFVVSIIAILFILFNYYIDWNKVFNVNIDIGTDFNLIVYIVFSAFCFQLVLKLINNILVANQRTAVVHLINLIANAISLILIIILIKIENGSLLYLAISLSIPPVLVLISASFYFYLNDYRKFAPNFKYVKLQYSKSLFSLGSKFFIIQTAALMVFTTDNMIITQLFGPADVTPYNIALKYFSIVTTIFWIIVNPFIPAYTEAFSLKDIKWIRNSINKLFKLWFGVILAAILMLLFSDFAYKLWFGEKIYINIYLSLGMAIFIIQISWNNIFSSFLIGVGKIRLQMYHSIFSIIINIPMSIFFAKTINMSSTGVILGTIITLLPLSILAPIQYQKLITNTANGLWNK